MLRKDNRGGFRGCVEARAVERGCRGCVEEGQQKGAVVVVLRQGCRAVLRQNNRELLRTSPIGGLLEEAVERIVRGAEWNMLTPLGGVYVYQWVVCTCAIGWCEGSPLGEGIRSREVST